LTFFEDLYQINFYLLMVYLKGSSNPNLQVAARSTDRQTTDNRAQVSGSLSNVLFGYTLLSK